MAKGGLRLREEDLRRLVFAVRVRDVHAHPAGAGGADLDVHARAALGGGAVDEADVADQLRDRLRQQELLQIDRAGGVEAVTVHPFEDLVGAFEHVLVRQPGGGVDAVDDHLGPVLLDQLHEVVRRVRVVEVAVQEVEQAATFAGVGQQLGARHVGEVRGHEQVAPGRHVRDGGSELGFQPRRRFAGFALEERCDDDAPRFELQGELTADLETDQARAAKNQHVVEHGHPDCGRPITSAAPARPRRA